MNSHEYKLKLHSSKTQSEREKINDEFLHSQVKTNKINKFKKFCKENAFTIFNTLIAVIALIVAIVK